ncbi:MAG: hypothetical protein RL323_907 [Pseudomonadota bacterium]
MLQRVLPDSLSGQTWQLFDADNTRKWEAMLAKQLPEHGLMQLAGASIFRWAIALYPHARHVWVACGPGNNGGDGLVAALALHHHLHPLGGSVYVTWYGGTNPQPPDARNALNALQAAGVNLLALPPDRFDLAIDAVFGLGRHVRNTSGTPYEAWLRLLHAAPQPVLAVDTPSQLDGNTGNSDCTTLPGGNRHTLALLTLKPGLFTGFGRNLAGDIWWDNLQPPGDLIATSQNATSEAPESIAPTATLFHPQLGSLSGNRGQRHRTHNTHKGLHGDLWVLGGEDSGEHTEGWPARAMTGAALLSARAGLHSGAGRVLVALLNRQSTQPLRVDPNCPDLIFQNPLELLEAKITQETVAVCGCGGGLSVHEVLPQLLASNVTLVLDADALNAIATAPERYQQALRDRGLRGAPTVLTPHPKEAARLLNSTSKQVNADRIEAAKTLADQFQCTVVLKGSGTVTAHPGLTPYINPTGNGLLGTAGTGDVLAGMIGGYLCRAVRSGQTDLSQAHAMLNTVTLAVHNHGRIADLWPVNTPFTAGQMPEHIPAA